MESTPRTAQRGLTSYRRPVRRADRGVLHHAGLLVDRKEGRSRVCGLRAAPLGEAHQWLGRYRAFWDERLEGLAGYLAGADE